MVIHYSLKRLFNFIIIQLHCSFKEEIVQLYGNKLLLEEIVQLYGNKLILEVNVQLYGNKLLLEEIVQLYGNTLLLKRFFNFIVILIHCSFKEGIVQLYSDTNKLLLEEVVQLYGNTNTLFNSMPIHCSLKGILQ